MSVSVISITSSKSLAPLLPAPSSCPKEMGQQLLNYISGCMGGADDASFDIQVNGGLAVAASKAGTFTGAPTAADTITLNGVVFTARASGAVANEFNIGGTVTITATNFAAAVNASVTSGISGYLSASSAAGVVTITAASVGVLGNLILISESCANFTFAGGATALSGGVNATANVYHLGA